jgi:hypothetical protein
MFAVGAEAVDEQNGASGRVGGVSMAGEAHDVPPICALPAPQFTGLLQHAHASTSLL